MRVYPKTAETHRIRRLFDEGKSDVEMAQELGCSTAKIESGRLVLGLKRKQRASDWTFDRVARLRQLAREGLTAQEIADAMGCSRQAVQSACRRYEVSLSSVVKKERDRKDDLVVKMVQAGEPREQIAAALGVSAKAVASRLWRLKDEGRIDDEPAALNDHPKAPVPATQKRALTAARKPERTAPRRTPAKQSRVSEAETRVSRLVARHGEGLISALAQIGRKGAYQKLARVAATHSMTERQVRAIWHQVSA